MVGAIQLGNYYRRSCGGLIRWRMDQLDGIILGASVTKSAFNASRYWPQRSFSRWKMGGNIRMNEEIYGS